MITFSSLDIKTILDPRQWIFRYDCNFHRVSLCQKFEKNPSNKFKMTFESKHHIV